MKAAEKSWGTARNFGAQHNSEPASWSAGNDIRPHPSRALSSLLELRIKGNPGTVED